jgi:hypothetical protein
LAIESLPRLLREVGEIGHSATFETSADGQGGSAAIVNRPSSSRSSLNAASEAPSARLPAAIESEPSEGMEHRQTMVRVERKHDCWAMAMPGSSLGFQAGARSLLYAGRPRWALFSTITPR